MVQPLKMVQLTNIETLQRVRWDKSPVTTSPGLPG